MPKRPAIFVDRDGTLIEEVNYLSRVEDLRLFPFTSEAARLFKEGGYLVIVVTNQSGIGRNIYSEDAMHAIHAEIQTKLGGAIDGFYYCPHLPCDGCDCRKPGLGMIEAACRDMEIDLSSSWIVGDKTIDVETGQNAGIRTAFVLTGYGEKHRSHLRRLPDIIADDLLDAAQKMIEYERILE
jgi:D-glycero-D-manno-heptose 1,7-bisphosphate phosphatase